MSRLTILLALLGLSTFASDDPTAKRLDRFLSGPKCPDFNGVVLLERNGSVVFHKAYGNADRDGQVAMTAQTPFCVASISKQFTASAILKLAQQGKLGLNDPVALHLKETPEDRANLTLHHLLCHLGGLGQNYAADGVKDRAEAVRAVFQTPIKSAPGEKFSYSNDGYSLLAAVVAKVSGQTFEDYMNQHLLAPARMKATTFWGRVDLNDPNQIAHIPQPGDTAWAQPSWGYRGGTGMITTTGDMYRWVQALREAKVLSKSSVQTLLAPHTPLSIGHATYGWFRSKSAAGRDLLWTRGTESFGHNALIVHFLEEKALLIIATNSGNIGDTAYAKYLGKALEPVIFPSKN